MSEATAATSAAPPSLPAIQNLQLQSEAASGSSSSSQSGRGRNRGHGRGRGGRANKKPGASSTPHDQPSATAADGSIAESSETPSGSTQNNARSSQSRRKGKRGSGNGGGGGDRSNKSNGAATGPQSNQDDNPSTSAPPRVAARRQQFGGKLTGGANSASDPSQNTSKPSQNGRPKKPVVKVAATAEPVEYADLRSRLLAELSSGEYDCVICYSTVTTRQATWSCSQCYSVLHLPCVRKWAESSVKKAQEHNAMQEDPEIRNRRGTWRCPGCQYAREDVPKIYWCWCGRTQDPPGGRGANPHGCGQRCSRGKCAHGCADACHPGPCPPCAVTVSQQCFCGSKSIPMRCSQTTTKEARLSSLHQRGTSCGDTCGQKLDCGIHSCEETCHPGDCQPCSVQMQARCYCGKHTKTMRCGDGTPRDSFDDSGAVTFQGHFACQDQCERTFDCGVHSCSQPCHARDAARPVCPSSPQLVTSCPCGAQPVTSRTSCQDPIPTCGSICSKMSKCGHPCPSPCHLGPCPPCQVPVSTPCRCGETKQSRTCHERQQEELEGGQEVLCATVCQSLRHCGKHQCNRQCCPLYFQAKSKSKKRPTLAEMQAMDPAGLHECSIPCSKPLACGLHDCPMTCHRGACPPCLQASFEELICHCGRTVLEPPVPCGTQVRCNFPCVRPAPSCGHPKMPHDCHEEEPCPPCVYLTDKVCHCQKHIVKNVPCSRSRVSCGQPCDALLNCGFHRCQGICHVAGRECAPCAQICGKPRRLCQHACQEKCHAPSSCPEVDPCEAVITLQCACGNLQSRTKCGVSMHAPNKEKSLKCNDSCMIAQRNAKLAEALGLNPSEKAAPAAYEYETLAYYAVPSNRKFCDEVEATLNDFIRSPRAGMILAPANKFQRKFTHELASVYKLATESVDQEPRRSVSIRRKQDSRIPKPLMTEAFAAARASLMSSQQQQQQQSQSQGKSIGLAQLQRSSTEAPKPLNAIFLPGVFGHDQDSLRSLLQPVLRTINFSVTWKGDEDVVITSADSPTRLIMMKTELKSLVRREQFARDAILCTVDASKNVVRREDEPMLSGSGSSSNSSSHAGSAWGSSAMKRGGAGLSGHGSIAKSSSGLVGDRGWAAVASGSGRNSPAPASEPVWGQPTMAAQSNGARATTTAPIAGIIPNPNAPRRAAAVNGVAANTAAATESTAAEGPVPEDWEDDN
ncbi:related to Shuttle craft protein [Sporisorium reilianum f. sp. reilianum]|uniref:Related to Shuttle craft protein n=1 Tax=Sporisorium reilianum f. sp. reilianum TaxID=72559 RepID=A0A2N8UH13_9BASI|nr:related to Shuttle craft protein [Sporisorium reilianum f. sp. reilianum]